MPSKRKSKQKGQNASSRPLTEADARRKAKESITRLVMVSSGRDGSDLDAFYGDDLWYFFTECFDQLSDQSSKEYEGRLAQAFNELNPWCEYGLLGMLAELVIQFADMASVQLDLATNLTLASEPSMPNELTWVRATTVLGHLLHAASDHSSSFSRPALDQIEEDVCVYGARLLRSLQSVRLLYASERCIGAVDVTTLNIGFIAQATFHIVYQQSYSPRLSAQERIIFYENVIGLLYRVREYCSTPHPYHMNDSNGEKAPAPIHLFSTSSTCLVDCFLEILHDSDPDQEYENIPNFLDFPAITGLSYDAIVSQAECVHHPQEQLGSLEARRRHYEVLTVLPNLDPNPLFFEAMAKRSHMRNSLLVARESLRDSSFLALSASAWDYRSPPASPDLAHEYLLPNMFDAWCLLISRSFRRRDSRPTQEAIDGGLLFLVEISSLPCSRPENVISSVERVLGLMAGNLQANEVPSLPHEAKLHAQVNVIRARLNSRPGVDPSLRDCWTLDKQGSFDDAWNNAMPYSEVLLKDMSASRLGLPQGSLQFQSPFVIALEVALLDSVLRVIEVT
ncbi:hypothetical protein DL93DRAFT_2173684 [Clavulina sp. PMI_390]|nr:hypothetical protein DL93DRAFT_2173684 [Clavulina sp. PMI_390]